MKKSTKTALICGLSGIIIFVVLFQFGYRKIADEVSSIKSSLNETETRLSIIQTYKANEAKYVDEIEEMKQKLALIDKTLPSNTLPENIISFVTDILPDGIYISSITFNNTESIAETKHEAEGYPKITVYNMSAGLAIDCDYKDFKRFLKEVSDSENRMSVESMVVSYNESTGKLSGTVVINSYYADGSEKEYVYPDIKPWEKGNSDIFQTIRTEEFVGDEEIIEETETE